MASSAPSAHAAAVLPIPVQLQPPTSVVAVVAMARRRAPVPATLALRALARRGAAKAVVSAVLDDDRRRRPSATTCRAGGGVLSRDSTESPDNSSSSSSSSLESLIVSSGQMSPAARLSDVMSRPVQVATAGQRLAEIDVFFAEQQYSGLPVVDDDGRCIGVISSKDKARAPNGMESTVGEVMSSPPITLTLYKTVLEAAVLMLKEKVHRIPVVNEQQYVIGIITRSDVFQTPTYSRHQTLEANNKA